MIKLLITRFNKCFINIQVVIMLRRFKKYRNLQPAHEDTWQYIIENANIAIIAAQNLSIKFANPAMELLIGYSRKEMVNQSIVKYVYPDDCSFVVGRHEQRMQGKDVPVSYEFRISTK
jgi:PAS domain S-box-containing protein